MKNVFECVTCILHLYTYYMYFTCIIHLHHVSFYSYSPSDGRTQHFDSGYYFFYVFYFFVNSCCPTFVRLADNDEIHNGVWIVVCSEWPWIIILGFLRIAALKNAHNTENIWELHHKLRASSRLRAFLPSPHGSTLEVQRAAGSQSHHIQMEGTVSVNRYLQWEAVYMVRGCCLLRV